MVTAGLKILFIALFAVIPRLSAHACPEWRLQKAAITFQIRNAGLPVQGSFSGAKASLCFDPMQSADGSLAASVETNTVMTGIAARDRHLRKETYFAAGQYPQITMRSVAIESLGQNQYRGRFALTIKGITREVTVPFTFRQTGNRGMFNGDFSVNRLDFGVGESSWLLADQVLIYIQIEVTR